MRSLFMLFLLLPSLAMASATDDLLARLQGLHSLSGGFQQAIQDQSGGQLQKASGEMTVARGNRFYWHTSQPYDQVVVSDGKQVWIYDKDLEQVVIKPLSTDLGKTPALLFGGDPAAVAKAFTIKEQDQQGGEVTFRLEPKGNDPLFDTLDVTFKGQMPLSMRLRDALGQITLIDFRDLTLNAAPAADRFHFDPPQGTDIIRQQ